MLNQVNRQPFIWPHQVILQRRDELLLSEHFSEGVRRVRRSLPGAPLKVLNFDWHGMMKDLKENATVEGLWMLLESICPQVNTQLCSLHLNTASSFRSQLYSRQQLSKIHVRRHT